MSEGTEMVNGAATETKPAIKKAKPAKKKTAKKPAAKAKSAAKKPAKKAAKKTKKGSGRHETQQFTPAQVDAHVRRFAKEWDVPVTEAKHKLMTIVINRMNALRRYTEKQ